MDKQQLSNLAHIQKASRDNRLVIFVGAGVSMNSGIPSWNALIDALKQDLPNGFSSETDALKIAQAYKDTRGHKEYMDKVKEILLYNKTVPNPLHKSIFALNPCHVITTNYDDLLEQQLANEFTKFHVIREDKDLPQMASSNTLVKMHGDFATDNIVLTESDYLNYKDKFPLIRAYVQSLFASKLVLFVGFSFTDLNLKMILNELQNILSENMQRAYLLSCEQPDYATMQYFEKKGINILYLSKEDANNVNGDRYVDSKLLPEVGLHTDKILHAIDNYSSTPKDDLALYLYNTVVPYMNDIRCFSDGLRHFFPKQKGLFWNTHSSGLQTGLDYFKNLSEELKTNPAKRHFLVEHPTINLKKLLQVAYYNYLFEIDGLEIIDDKFWENESYYIKTPVIKFIHRFNFEEVSKRIQELRTEPVSYTIDDLELPYTLFMLGDAWEAYQHYLKLIPLYWNRQKYILYFLCRYNLWAIRHRTHFQLMFDNEHDANKETEFASSDELDHILSRLPLSPEIKKIFQDIFSYRFIGSKTIETGRLKEQIYQQRRLAEKGGCSINSNITHLMSLYERESQFSWANYVVWENNGYFNLIAENYITGILNSLATPSTSMFGCAAVNSRITALSEGMIEALVFSIANKRLMEIIKGYDINTLNFNEDGVNYINSCFEGLLKKHPCVFKDKDLLYSPLKNLLLIISKSKDNRVHVEKLYSLIVKYQSDSPIFQISNHILERLIETYPPEEKSAKDLISKLLCTTTDHQQYAYCIEYLVKIWETQGVCYNELNFDAIPEKKKLATEISLLYSVTTDELKETIKNFSLTNLDDLPGYMSFIYHNKISTYSPERFKELLDKTKMANMTDRCVFLLAEIRNDTLFEDVHSNIDDIAKNCNQLRFYLSPSDYEQPENVNIEWLFVFDDETKKQLFQKEIFKKKLKQFIADNDLSKSNRTYLLKFL